MKLTDRLPSLQPTRRWSSPHSSLVKLIDKWQQHGRGQCFKWTKPLYLHYKSPRDGNMLRSKARVLVHYSLFRLNEVVLYCATAGWFVVVTLTLFMCSPHVRNLQYKLAYVDGKMCLQFLSRSRTKTIILCPSPWMKAERRTVLWAPECNNTVIVCMHMHAWLC